MTSNIGSHIIQEQFEKMLEPEYNEEAMLEETKNMVFDLLKKSVRPEFLNRIDEISMFKPLNREDIRKIVSIQLNGLKNKLEKDNIILDWTDEAVLYLANKGFNPEFGARPLKRVIQREVLNGLSDQLLLGKINPEDAILIDAFDEGIVFRNPVEELVNGGDVK